MCISADFIRGIRDIHRDVAVTIANWEANELQLHLAIECEKYLRRHESRCAECAKENQMGAA